MIASAMALPDGISGSIAGRTILTAFLAFPNMRGDASRRSRDLDGLRAARRAELEKLWRDGAPVEAIAGRLDITVPATHSLARRMGLPPRPSPAEAASALAWTPEREALGADLWRCGLSAARCLPKLNALPGPLLTSSAIEFHARKVGWRREIKLERGKPVANAPAPAPWGHPDPVILRLLGAPDPTLAQCRTRAPAEPCATGACRWPFGDPRTPAFRFCAEDRTRDGSYCGVHAQRACWTPAAGPKQGNGNNASDPGNAI